MYSVKNESVKLNIYACLAILIKDKCVKISKMDESEAAGKSLIIKF